MTNLATAWNNLALNATLTASSEATNMLVTKLQQEDTKRNWRTGAVTSASISIDLGSVKTFDTLGLFNTNLLADGTYRLRASIADPTMAVNVYDSGTIAGAVDPNYKDLILLLATPITTARYLKLDLAQPTVATYLEAGFLFIGLRTQFDYDYGFGAGRSRIDPSTIVKMDAGNTRVQRNPGYWHWEIPIEFVTNAQWRSVLDQIDLLNGRSLPVLFIMNPASTNLGRDTIFGLIQESTPAIMLNAQDDTGAVAVSRTFSIDQRL